MSYEEARKDRKRSRKNAGINQLLMALSGVGNIYARGKAQTKAQEQRMAIEEWRNTKNLERDEARADRLDARQLRSIESQSDVANIYASSRSQNDSITGLEAETSGYDTSEIQAIQTQLQSIVDDPGADLGAKMSALEQLKNLPQQARRAGMRQHQASQQSAAQPNLTGGQDPEQTMVPGQATAQGSQAPGFFGNVLQSQGQIMGEPMGDRAAMIAGQPANAQPMQQQPPSGAMPPAEGVGGRQQAQFGNIRDAMQRMLQGQGSPADEALINEFFGYQTQQGPQQPMPPMMQPTGAPGGGPGSGGMPGMWNR